MRRRVQTFLFLGIIVIPSLLAAGPPAITGEERAACEAVIAFLSTGPAALYERLSSDAPLRKLPHDDAVAEIATRTGPADGATWQLRSAGGKMSGKAVFSVIFPSHVDDVIVLEMKQENGDWKIRSIRSLVEPTTTGTIPPPENQPPAAPAKRTTPLLLFFAILAPLLSIGGAATRRAHPRASSGLLLGAFAFFAVELALLMNPRIPVHVTQWVASDTPKQQNEFGQPAMRSLLPLRKALASGGRIPAHATGDPKLVDVVRLWTAQREVPGNSPKDLSAVGALGEVPLLELLRARNAASRRDASAALHHYANVVAADGNHDAFWFEELSLPVDDKMRADIVERWKTRGCRDAALYYIWSMRQAAAGNTKVAHEAFRTAWRMQPIPREAVVSAGWYADLLRDPAIASLVNLTAPEEWAGADLDLGRDAITLAQSATTLASGQFLLVTTGKNELSIPGGASIAPSGTRVVDALEWERRESASALAAIRDVGASRNRPPSVMERPFERAIDALVRRNRWDEVVSFTDWLRPDDVRVAPAVLVARVGGLVRAGRTEEARQLAEGSVLQDSMAQREGSGVIVQIADAPAGAGEFNSALQLYKRAATSADSTDLSPRIRQVELRRAIAASPRLIETRHFAVRATANVPQPVAMKIGEILELEVVRVARRLDLPAFQRVRVNVLGWDDFSTQLTGREDVLGFFDSDIVIPFAEVANFREDVVSILTHELTHAVVAQATGNKAPTWYQEGVARRMELVPQQKNPFTNRSAEHVLALAVLDATLSSSADPEAIDEAYAVSHAWIRFLEDQYGPDVLLRMNEEFGRGADTDEALMNVTGMRTPEVDRKFRLWGAANSTTFVDRSPWPYDKISGLAIDPTIRKSIRFSRTGETP